MKVSEKKNCNHEDEEVINATDQNITEHNTATDETKAACFRESIIHHACVSCIMQYRILLLAEGMGSRVAQCRP